MSSRAGLRFLNTFRQSAFRQSFIQKRSVQSAAENVTAAPPKSKISELWNSNVGPKTVHFWAPVMKWGLVLAGAADFARPAESLSLSQNAALMATGLIWTRWCFIIKPRNLFLASVNFLLFCVGATQVTRVLSYQASLENKTIPQEIEDAAKAEGHRLEAVVKDPKGALKKVERDANA